MKSGLS